MSVLFSAFTVEQPMCKHHLHAGGWLHLPSLSRAAVQSWEVTRTARATVVDPGGAGVWSLTATAVHSPTSPDSTSG